MIVFFFFCGSCCWLHPLGSNFAVWYSRYIDETLGGEEDHALAYVFVQLTARLFCNVSICVVSISITISICHFILFRRMFYIIWSNHIVYHFILSSMSCCLIVFHKIICYQSYQIQFNYIKSYPINYIKSYHFQISISIRAYL